VLKLWTKAECNRTTPGTTAAQPKEKRKKKTRKKTIMHRGEKDADLVGKRPEGSNERDEYREDGTKELRKPTRYRKKMGAVFYYKSAPGIVKRKQGRQDGTGGKEGPWINRSTTSSS